MNIVIYVYGYLQGGMMNTYKLTFDFELEVDCEEENINDEVLNWIMQNGLYPLYKIQTITEEE